ncbi:hypothetical protein L0F51_04060 [Afifella sp. H1R]|uniref:hypothetical protein n=1 Tax=Afifella sp. H1R TaxID=2908841 RepID=UPI001F1A46B2|nr:hypothetical protein [Afifella sp. H1R]MCF1502939.1 hypothetical protein [Afifella sp. H1R]
MVDDARTQRRAELAAGILGKPVGYWVMPEPGLIDAGESPAERLALREGAKNHYPAGAAYIALAEARAYSVQFEDLLNSALLLVRYALVADAARGGLSVDGGVPS